MLKSTWERMILFVVINLFGLAALILLFKRKKNLTIIIIGLYTFNLIYVVTDKLLLQFSLNLLGNKSAGSVSAFIGALGQLILWGQYFLSSKRVKATFIE